MINLSVVIPIKDERDNLAPLYEQVRAALDPLVELRQLGVEVIAVDGGSRDATIQRARLRVDRVFSAPRERTSQVNAGAEKASGDVLLFLDPKTSPAKTRAKVDEWLKKHRLQADLVVTSIARSGGERSF